MKRNLRYLKCFGFLQVICIYQTDWDSVCDSLKTMLLEMASDDQYKDCFPPNPSFFWQVSQLGQCMKYDRTNLTPLEIYNKAVNPLGRCHVSVHCAKDYYLRDEALFWIPDVILPRFTPRRAVSMFFPALIPGLGNLVYDESHLNFPQISFIQYYTKVFSPAHRDTSRLFQCGQVTAALFQKYCQAHTGKGAKDPPGRPNQLQRILRQYNRFGDSCRNLAMSCRGTTPARLEVVWTTSEPFNTISEVITRAFVEADQTINIKLFENIMLQNIPSNSLEEHIRLWTDTFGGAVSKLSSNKSIPISNFHFAKVSSNLSAIITLN